MGVGVGVYILQQVVSYSFLLCTCIQNYFDSFYLFSFLEPEAADTDCWAQGSVPKNIIPPRPISPVAEEFDEHPDVIDEEPPAL